MKVEQAITKFKPIEIKIVLETEEEAIRFKKTIERDARTNDEYNKIINIINGSL